MLGVPAAHAILLTLGVLATTVAAVIVVVIVVRGRNGTVAAAALTVAAVVVSLAASFAGTTPTGRARVTAAVVVGVVKTVLVLFVLGEGGCGMSGRKDDLRADMGEGLEEVRKMAVKMVSETIAVIEGKIENRQGNHENCERLSGWGTTMAKSHPPRFAV